MLRKRTTIEISPTRLELALVRGRCATPIRSECLVFDRDASWPQRLDSISARLDEWRLKTGVNATLATVLYTGGESLATLVSSAASIPASARRPAALLALADRVTFPLDGQPADVQVLARDRASASEDSPPQTHLLAAADTDESLSALVAVIERAGFQPGVVMPAAAAELARAVNLAIERSRTAAGAADGKDAQSGGAIMVLRFGEHASVLAAAECGRLRFARSLPIGAETLVAALAPALGDPGGMTARELLYAVGIPASGDVIDGQKKVTGQTLLPLLQPVLQRCVVELKQSLRFGLSKRGNVHLLVDGFGAHIPRLVDVLADAVGIPARVDRPAHPGAETPASSDCGPIAALSTSPLKISLLPIKVAAERSSRRLQALLGAGALAAAVFVAVDGMVAHASANRLEQQITLLEQQSAGHVASYEDQASDIARITATSRAVDRLSEKLGQSPDWAATLTFIANATPGHIRLDRIAMVDEDSGHHCRLSGRVQLESGASGAAELHRYVNALAAAPIIRSVHLGATGRVAPAAGSGRGEDAEQHFELTIELVALPAAHHYRQIVAATEVSP